MAILSKNKPTYGGPSSGHSFSKLDDKIFGYRKGRLNKYDHVYNNDYVWIYDECDENGDEKEVGHNKKYHLVHDDSWFDSSKNDDFNEVREERRYHRMMEMMRRVGGG